MLTPKLRVALIGLTVGALAFPGIAAAAGRAGIGGPIPFGQVQTNQAVEVAPTGDGPAGEAECKRYENAINSWKEEVLDRNLAGDNKGAATANGYVNALKNQATDDGCFVIH